MERMKHLELRRLRDIWKMGDFSTLSKFANWHIYGQITCACFFLKLSLMGMIVSKFLSYQRLIPKFYVSHNMSLPINSLHSFIFTVLVLVIKKDLQQLLCMNIIIIRDISKWTFLPPLFIYMNTNTWSSVSNST